MQLEFRFDELTAVHYENGEIWGISYFLMQHNIGVAALILWKVVYQAGSPPRPPPFRTLLRRVSDLPSFVSRTPRTYAGRERSAWSE